VVGAVVGVRVGIIVKFSSDIRVIARVGVSVGIILGVKVGKTVKFNSTIAVAEDFWNFSLNVGEFVGNKDVLSTACAEAVEMLSIVMKAVGELVSRRFPDDTVPFV